MLRRTGYHGGTSAEHSSSHRVYGIRHENPGRRAFGPVVAVRPDVRACEDICRPARSRARSTIPVAASRTDRLYAAYRLDLPARGQIRIDLSTGGDFLLILRDSSGMKIESGTAIRRAIEAGSYTLLVNGRTPGQVGDFTVQTRFTVEPGVICTGWAIARIEPGGGWHARRLGLHASGRHAYEGYLRDDIRRGNAYGVGFRAISPRR